jgi:sigma-E factor negative regulatory protein RseA
MNSQSLPVNPAAAGSSEAIRVAVSAWMDEAAGPGPALLHGTQADAARDAWSDFHTVGDALRAPELGALAADQARQLRVRQAVLAQLAQTAQDPAPDVEPRQPLVVVPVAVETKGALGRANVAAANAPVWRWRLAAAVATVVATGSLIWNLGPAGVRGDAAEVASATQSQNQVVASGQTVPSSTAAAMNAEGPAATVAVATGAGVMIRDARLDELLAAHRQHGGASALQLPTGFLRAATFEGAGR